VAWRPEQIIERFDEIANRGIAGGAFVHQGAFMELDDPVEHLGRRRTSMQREILLPRIVLIPIP
jgi:hypothetical protein